MRAREPDYSGTLDRDGVKVGYEVHGDGSPTVVLLPTFPIIDRRLWKGQIAHLARHHRVLVLEPRGHGSSDRSTDPSDYTGERRSGDVVALLDETGADRAVLAGVSLGGSFALRFAAEHADRTSAVVSIAPGLGVDADHPLRQAIQRFDEEHGRDEGFWRYNRHSWQRDFDGFVRFFVGQIFNQPHSTKHVEDGVSYGLETSADVVTAHEDGVRASRLGGPGSLQQLAEQVRCPVLIIHGTDDAICPVRWSQAAAPWFRARLEVIDGGGHGVHARMPVRVNSIIDDFLAELGREGVPAVPSVPARRGRSGGSGRSGPRVLYLSSPIGLGHARRDIAIAVELRDRAPDVSIDWLAQDPVAGVLRDRGETIHPGSAYLASESAHVEAETADHDLHAFEALRRMDEILVANFMIFDEAVRDGGYDLVVGDEAWDVDHFLHEEPGAKNTRFAWLTDFVGLLPMPDKGPRDAWLTADYNAEMLEHVERHPGVRDVSLFVGDPDDVVDVPFGPGLPSIRPWTEHHYEFSGYITGFDPAGLPERDEARAELGCAPDQRLCIAAVGGSGVGISLLRLVLDAHRVLARSIDGLRTIVVTGPRIDPDSLPDVPGVEKRAYVPDLHTKLVAADLAVVQGGLTTTMELVAAGVPFLYVPLLNHFEQQIHVRHRLERYGAGKPIDYAAATPESLAEAMAARIGVEVAYRPVSIDGAAKAARALAAQL